MLGLLALVFAADTHAQASDYAIENVGWNGLSEFIALARSLGLDVRAPSHIDLRSLTPRDGLLIIYPAAPPPKADLAAFMIEGGRLGVADDFGASTALLASFGVQRRAPGTVAEERRLHGNPNVLIAKPGMRHPLGSDVPALVTNHPAVLHHDELEAIFSLDDAGGAVVVSGAVNKGRLTAISDPSVLINNMLEFRGNRSFARNLARYLARDGRLFVATPNAEFVGHYGGVTSRDPLAVLRLGLARAAQARLPASAIRVMAMAIAALLLFTGVTALPRASSYARAVSLPAAEAFGGFAGRVRFFNRRESNLLAPLLAFKREFERTLFEQLTLSGQPTLDELGSALRARGVAQHHVDDAGTLLIELRGLSLAQDRPEGPPRIAPRKFHDMVARGERILAALPIDRAEKRSP